MESVRTQAPREADEGVGVVETRFERFEEPLELACGDTLPGFTLAWERYGELNAERDNAVLLFHALTGSHPRRGHEPRSAGPRLRLDGRDGAGLVARVHRSRPRARHGPLLRHLRQLRRRLLRVDRAGVDRPGDRRAVGAVLSARSRLPPPLRLGQGRDAPGRPARDRRAARGRRTLDRRHGSARPGGHVPGAGAQRRRHRRRHGSDAAPEDPQLRADPGDRQRPAVRWRELRAGRRTRRDEDRPPDQPQDVRVAAHVAAAGAEHGGRARRECPGTA